MYKPGELRGHVIEEVYPPSITVEVTQSEMPRALKRHRIIHLLVCGTKVDPLTFPIHVYEKEGEFVTCTYSNEERLHFSSMHLTQLCCHAHA